MNRVVATLLVDKESFRKGWKLTLLINEHGYGEYIMDENVVFSPDEYEIFISDKEFDKLLGSKQ